MKAKMKLFSYIFLVIVISVDNSILAQSDSIFMFQSNGNPIVSHRFTPDPAALVVGDTLWLFTGHDVGEKNKKMILKDWRVFSTTDLKNWTEYPIPLKVSDFTWDETGRAYAAQVINRNGKYYWYISTDGSGIGVAVSDRPEGPYKDAIGKPLLTKDDCFASKHRWACIDPSVFVDNNGVAWLFWGNGQCYYAKLKDNMIEIDGEIKQVLFDGFEFEEASWVHKYNNKYYLSYASGLPEKIAYAMADNIEGPWEYKGILNEIAGNSSTNHQSIVEFKGQWYFFYHNGSHQRGGSPHTRSVCVDSLHYNLDGTMKRVIMTTEGVAPVNGNNPVINGYYADPEILYAHKTNKYYIYPTSDGHKNWDGDYFKVFSSENLKDWKDEGVILDLKKDVLWAQKKAWAPCIIEKKGEKEEYNYYYYYTGDGKIGVATAKEPTGPFTDLGKPLIDWKPEGINRGAEIDPDVFHDPISGKKYLYWGNGYCAVVELNEDMVSYKKETLRVITPPYFREGLYVFYRNGLYYFLWSENDTRSEDYQVRYGTSTSPIGPINTPKHNIILHKRPDKGIYATGHNSVLQIQGKDEWYIVYHRFTRPEGVKMGRMAGYYREICIDKMEFDKDGRILPVEPTL